MRQLSAANEPDSTLVSDTVATVVISSAGAVVAQDYPSGAHYMHLSATMGLYINFSSTGVLIPTASLSATTSSSGLSIRHNSGHEHFYRIPAGSTGYSIISESSGVGTIEFWEE
jgi:hypothetical protein